MSEFEVTYYIESSAGNEASNLIRVNLQDLLNI